MRGVLHFASGVATGVLGSYLISTSEAWLLVAAVAAIAVLIVVFLALVTDGFERNEG